jgi:hypothetical protein
MSYRDNWLKHMFAAVSGNGCFSDELARDFWFSKKEDPWNLTQDVARRWWKLLFAYSASAIAQISLPLALLGMIIIPLKHHEWKWLFIGIGFGTVMGVVAASLAATRVCMRISEERKRRR